MANLLRQLNKKSKKARVQNLQEAGRFLGVSVLAIMILLSILGLVTYAFQAQAATGINTQLNYQGKLNNADGTSVADGTYSLKFVKYFVT